MKFIVVDDDPVIVKFLTKVLIDGGHTVVGRTKSVGALEEVLAETPDCVLIDLMMPEMDGFELCRQLREHPDLKTLKIIIVSSKSFEFDRNRAFELGADGYIVKPFEPDEFLSRVERIVEDRMEVRFWGVRGTLPVPGKQALRYGGNTSCITVEFSRERFFIFDAGTGIKALSDHLMAQGRAPLAAKVFISHPHWDHINALPFFVPLYVPGGEFAIHGAHQGNISVREMISAQMEGVYFPITIKEFGARVYFVDLGEETLDFDGVTVTTKLLNHPGNCLGYRVEYRGRRLCYVTDNELYLTDHPHYNERYEEQLAEFVHGADMLITDVTYTDEEYPKKVNWGHSCVSRVADLAHRAEVKTLYLHHHDPDQSDDDIDAKLVAAKAALAQRGSATECVAPAEGDMVKL